MSDLNLPKHVAIIMDGNGRWAKARNMPRTNGHHEGVKRVEEIIDQTRILGIEVLTLYAFSTENWSRPKQEVNMLMKTFASVMSRKIKKLHKQNVKFRMIGRIDGLPKSVADVMTECMVLTENNSGLNLNIAINYGSRLEIIDAIKGMTQKVLDGQISVEDINETMLSEALYTQGQPDPDLLIRTSGEQRISNFLSWQLAYSEFYFTEKYWPDFTLDEYDVALQSFSKRMRRYGGVEIKS